MTDRRRFVAWLGSLPLVGGHHRLRAAPPIVIDATPTALYQQPDGRNNLVQVAVSGLDAPAARARVTDRRGTLVGTAGLLATGAGVAASGSRHRAAGPSTGSRRATPTSASPRFRKTVSNCIAGIWMRRWPGCARIPTSAGRRSARST